VPGENLPHVRHYYTEPHEYYRKKVVVVGGKNSAAITALELYRSGAAVTLIHRGARLSDSIKYWILPDIENRIREGSIRALFNTVVVRIGRALVTSSRNGYIEKIPADAVLLLTGYHPDTDLMARAGVQIDPVTLVPRHDRETMETNVPGLYAAGSVVSGKDTNRIFIENGRFHGERIVRHILSRPNRG
jgi:thioredoxin reductase (NADPH)